MSEYREENNWHGEIPTAISDECSSCAWSVTSIKAQLNNSPPTEIEINCHLNPISNRAPSPPFCSHHKATNQARVRGMMWNSDGGFESFLDSVYRADLRVVKEREGP